MTLPLLLPPPKPGVCERCGVASESWLCGKCATDEAVIRQAQAERGNAVRRKPKHRSPW